METNRRTYGQSNRIDIKLSMTNGRNILMIESYYDKQEDNPTNI